MPAERLVPSNPKLAKGRKRNFKVSARNRIKTTTPLTERQVLVVDDSRTIRTVLCEFLADIGFMNVAEAEDGKEGLRTFRALKPGVVFLDLNIPKVNGAEVAERILAEDPHAKVVVVSAEDNNEEKKKLLAMGVYDYLSKPVKREDLLHLVERMRSELASPKIVDPVSVELIPGGTLLECSTRTDGGKLREFLDRAALPFDSLHVFASPNSMLDNMIGGRGNTEWHSPLDKLLIGPGGPDTKFHAGESVSSGRIPRIADAVSSVIEENEKRRLLMIFDGLTDSIIETGFETNYSLLKELQRILSQQGTPALFLLNAKAHDERQLTALRGILPQQVSL
ncbi:MAG TPA: response regulator [Nitrososphaerales archaeon]|nr:response regulator [Nitrososphaerales archaeon]